MNNNSRYVSSQGASVSAGIKIPETSTAASRMESSYSGKVTSKHRRACFIFQQPENILGGGEESGRCDSDCRCETADSRMTPFHSSQEARKTMHDEELDRRTLCSNVVLQVLF